MTLSSSVAHEHLVQLLDVFAQGDCQLVIVVSFKTGCLTYRRARQQRCSRHSRIRWHCCLALRALLVIVVGRCRHPVTGECGSSSDVCTTTQ